MSPTKLKNREELPLLLSQVIESIKHDKTKVDTIKENLRTEYGILPGKIQKIISNSEEELAKNDDLGLLYLLTNEVYIASGEGNIDPRDYFNTREIKEIKTNFEPQRNEQLTFPYTFEKVIKGADDNFLVYSDGKTVKDFFENKLFQYNTETQREARQKKTSSGEVIEAPKINDKSVKEIEDLIVKNKYDALPLTLNARLRSADEGEELIYDENKMTLTITEGTLLDVLDGFHRINAIARALRKNDSINPIVPLNIVNYGKQRAKEKFVQINTLTVVGTGHLKKMSETRQSDFIAKQVQFNSELNNKVAASDIIAPTSDLLVTFNTLSDSIDHVYGIKERSIALQTSEYLTEFFNNLFYSFPEAFMDDISEVRKNSLINANVMFNGYILLSKRMLDENIALTELPNIIKEIDFSRTNKEWKKKKVIDASGRVTNNAKKEIYNFFSGLKLK